MLVQDYPSTITLGILLLLTPNIAHGQQNINSNGLNHIPPHEMAEGKLWGASIAQMDDTLFISATGDVEEGEPGLVWEMVLNGDSWEYGQMFESPASPGDGFGHAVAVADSILVIGAPFAENEDGDVTGKVFLYLKEEEDWKLEYELSPENLYDGARFGHSLAADSGRVIVGAPDQQGYDELENAGSAYGFDLTRNPGEKPEASNINVSMPSSNEHFGHAVDIKGGWAIISTFESGMVVGPRNRVFLFDQSEVNGGWYRREYLTKSGDNWPQYGTDVAISRESALVGFPREQVDGSQVGGVYSFSGFQSSEGINEPEILTPAHPQGFMNYGSGVAVSSEILAVSSNDGVEIYNWLDNAWSRTAIFEPQIAGEISFTGRVAVNDHFVVASGVPNTEDGYNNPGIYWQRLDEVTSAQKKRQMTTGFELEKAYPNPFNPTTVIQYSLSNADYVRLEVFDLLGRKVDILADGIKPAGEHTAVFNGTQLTSGVYIYTIKVGNSIMTEKMTMIK